MPYTTSLLTVIKTIFASKVSDFKQCYYVVARIGQMQETNFVVCCIRKHHNCQKGAMLNTDIDLNIVNIKERECCKWVLNYLLVGILIKKKNQSFGFLY